MVKKITELTEDCKAQLDEFYNSDFSNNLQFRLEQRKSGGNPIINQFLKTDFIFVFVVTGGHGLVLFHRHANILVKWHVH